ncbi:MAG TPA: hypothetical protein VF974_06090 [Patescibacteria group bacterium]
MATIPNLAQQPGDQQGFQPSLNATVQTAQGCVHFSMQTDPLTIKTTIVPDQLMIQVIAIWLKEHPNEAAQIIRAVKDNHRQEMDIIRTVESSKNRG